MQYEFLQLSPKQRTFVSDTILNASLVFNAHRDHRTLLIEKKNRSAGNIKKIYQDLIDLSDKEFNTLITAMTE